MLPGVSGRVIQTPASSTEHTVESILSLPPSHCFFTGGAATPRYGASPVSSVQSGSPGSLDNLMLRQENYCLRQKVIQHERSQAALHKEIARINKDYAEALRLLSAQHYRAREAERQLALARQERDFLRWNEKSLARGGREGGGGGEEGKS